MLEKKKKNQQEIYTQMLRHRHITDTIHQPWRSWWVRLSHTHTCRHTHAAFFKIMSFWIWKHTPRLIWIAGTRPLVAASTQSGEGEVQKLWGEMFFHHLPLHLCTECTDFWGGFRYKRKNEENVPYGWWGIVSEDHGPYKIRRRCIFCPVCFRVELWLIVSSKPTRWCTPSRRWTLSNKRWANKDPKSCSENILTTFCAYDQCFFIKHMHFWHVDPLISAKTIIFLFIKPTSPAARWVEWLHARADEDDGRHHDFRPAGGRVRSRRGLPQLLPRLPDGRGHPPSTPGQR